MPTAHSWTVSCSIQRGRGSAQPPDADPPGFRPPQMQTPPPWMQTHPWIEWHTGVKTLPCPNLRLWAVINDSVFINLEFSRSQRLIIRVWLRDTTAVYHPTMTYFIAGPHRLTKMSSKHFSDYQLRLHNYYMYDFILAAKPRIDMTESLIQELRYYWPYLPPVNEVGER